MSHSIDDAIAALRRGDQQTAFEVLQAYLGHSPDHVDAWYWLSEATPELPRKVEALHRFIELAPDHPRVPMVELRLNYLKGQLSKLSPDAYALALRPRDAAVPAPTPTLPPLSAKTAALRPLSVVLNDEIAAETPPRPAPPMGRQLLQSLLDSATPLPPAPDEGADTYAEPIVETPLEVADTPATPRRRPAWWVWLLIGLVIIQMIGLLYLLIRLEWVLQQVG